MCQAKSCEATSCRRQPRISCFQVGSAPSHLKGATVQQPPALRMALGAKQPPTAEVLRIKPHRTTNVCTAKYIQKRCRAWESQSSNGVIDDSCSNTAVCASRRLTGDVHLVVQVANRRAEQVCMQAQSRSEQTLQSTCRGGIIDDTLEMLSSCCHPTIACRLTTVVIKFDHARPWKAYQQVLSAAARPLVPLST